MDTFTNYRRAGANQLLDVCPGALAPLHPVSRHLIARCRR
jgi:hypothetical protein